MLGWSLYDLSLRVWLAEVAGAGQLLVTYTEELDAAPERVLGAIERHVGLDAHKYKNAHQKNNVAGCYGWQNKGAVHHSKGAAGCKGSLKATFKCGRRQWSERCLSHQKQRQFLTMHPITIHQPHHMQTDMIL